MRSSTAPSASAKVARLASLVMPDLKAPLIAIDGFMACDKLSVSRCENLRMRKAAPVTAVLSCLTCALADQ